MPNYGLMITPTYNPMKYEDYAKPFEDYAKVYNQMADAYDALEMEANQWEKLANNDKDAPQYQQYLNYANALREAAANLADHGLNPRTRGTVSNMRQRYSKEIKPIEDAYKRREQLAEEQRKLNPTGTKLYDVDYGNVGLGYVLQNPSAGYRTVDLPTVTNEVAEVMKNYKQVLMDSGQWGKTNVSGLLQRIERYGLTPEDISAITDPNNKDYNNPLYQQIRDVVDRAYQNTGVEDWGDDAKSEAVYRAAVQGIHWGLGTGNVRDNTDPWMQWYIWKKQQKYAEEQQANQEKLWDRVGHQVDVSEDDNIKEQKKNLDVLTKIAQSGKIPSEEIEKEVYVSNAVQVAADKMQEYVNKKTAEDPNWNPNLDLTYGALNANFQSAINSSPSGAKKKKIKVENPDYKVYKDLSALYKTEDLITLRDAYKSDYEQNVRSQATLNKYTILNSATNDRTMHWLENQVLSGLSDDEIKRIVKIGTNVKQTDLKDSGDPSAPKSGTIAGLREALRDADTSFQVNWNNGKVKIHNIRYGDFWLDTSVLHNLNVPFMDGKISADKYIPVVVQLYNDGKITEESLNAYISNFYTALETNSRMLVQEPSATSSSTQM